MFPPKDAYAAGAWVFALIGGAFIYLGVKPMQSVKVAVAKGKMHLARVWRTRRNNNVTSTFLMTELHLANKILACQRRSSQNWKTARFTPSMMGTAYTITIDFFLACALFLEIWEHFPSAYAHVPSAGKAQQASRDQHKPGQKPIETDDKLAENQWSGQLPKILPK